MPQVRAFSVASQSLTAVRNPDRAASSLVRRAVPVDIRGKALPEGSPDRIPADPAPSILPAPALPAPDPAVQEALAHVLVLAHVLASADPVPAASALVQAVLRLRAKLPVRSVLRDRRVAVAVSSIPRLKKAR